MAQAAVTSFRATISGTGHYVPSRVLTNYELETMVDTNHQWIVERTGIYERRIASPEETTSDMAAHAARQALESAGISAQDLDLIIVGTVTPDMPLPSTAMFLQQKLCARPNCPGFDLSAACAGFIYGLSIADQFVRSGQAKHVLVVGVELLSRILNWNDRKTCVLFGDGAGAVVVSRSEDANRGIISTHLYADGSLADALLIPAGGSKQPTSNETVSEKLHYVKMAGQELFKFAVKSLASATLEAITSGGLSPEQIDWVIPHQANIRILEGVAKRSGIPPEKFFINIQKYGNTSSASVPIALDEAIRSGVAKPGQSVVLCALGGGVAWGSALVRI